jgi:nucleoside-diphosphate-sugar epimerase
MVMYKTIMITGASGYIGSWTVKELLEKGFTVRACVRDKSNTGKVQHLVDLEKKTPGKLELWEADLLKEGSFDAVAKGCDAIFHMASPFTLRFKDAQNDLIKPALQGTKNVLNAASRSGTVRKVILTSSIVAIYGDNIDMKEKGLAEFTEADFNTTSTLTHQPYAYSKVLAEKEAWKMAEAQNQWKLVVMNPAFVMGPMLSAASDSESLQFMKDMLGGKYRTGGADLYFAFVDVRDVAKAHRLALENDRAEGRFILCSVTKEFMEVAAIIRNKYDKQFKLPVMKTPTFMLYLIGWMFGLSLRFVHRNMGHPVQLNNSKSMRELGMTYIPFERTIADMVDRMISLHLTPLRGGRGETP